MTGVAWQIETGFGSANQAEHALVGDHELIAFDVPADSRGDGAAIGWEIFTGARDYLDLIAKGDSSDFEAAKRYAEIHLAAIGGSDTRR